MFLNIKCWLEKIIYVEVQIFLKVFSSLIHKQSERKTFGLFADIFSVAEFLFQWFKILEVAVKN